VRNEIRILSFQREGSSSIQAHNVRLTKWKTDPRLSTLKPVRWVSHSTQALVSFARNLKTAGLLY
jgi:hypothetical protein